MDAALLTTREAARLLNVAPSTVKRWADEGRLHHVRTAGGHRRFPLDAVERMREAQVSEPAGPAEPGPEHERTNGHAHPDPVAAALDVQAGVTTVLSHLLLARAHRGGWWRVADDLGPALARMGEDWAEGRIDVMREHLASERLARALAQVAELVPVAPEAPRCLLLTSEGEEHTLGLSLAEVVAREAGWSTLWAGRRTPVEEVEAALGRGDVDLVAVSASVHSQDAGPLAALERRLATAARAAGVRVVIGGQGAWPARPEGAVRVRSFEAFRRVLLTGREAAAAV